MAIPASTAQTSTKNPERKRPADALLEKNVADTASENRAKALGAVTVVRKHVELRPPKRHDERVMALRAETSSVSTAESDIAQKEESDRKQQDHEGHTDASADASPRNRTAKTATISSRLGIKNPLEGRLKGRANTPLRERLKPPLEGRLKQSAATRKVPLAGRLSAPSADETASPTKPLAGRLSAPSSDETALPTKPLAGRLKSRKIDPASADHNSSSVDLATKKAARIAKFESATPQKVSKSVHSQASETKVAQKSKNSSGENVAEQSFPAAANVETSQSEQTKAEVIRKKSTNVSVRSFAEIMAEKKQRKAAEEAKTQVASTTPQVIQQRKPSKTTVPTKKISEAVPRKLGSASSPAKRAASSEVSARKDAAKRAVQNSRQPPKKNDIHKINATADLDSRSSKSQSRDGNITKAKSTTKQTVQTSSKEENTRTKSRGGTVAGAPLRAQKAYSSNDSVESSSESTSKTSTATGDSASTKGKRAASPNLKQEKRRRVGSTSSLDESILLAESPTIKTHPDSAKRKDSSSEWLAELENDSVGNDVNYNDEFEAAQAELDVSSMLTSSAGATDDKLSDDGDISDLEELLND